MVPRTAHGMEAGSMKRAFAGACFLALICSAAFCQSSDGATKTEAPATFELADVHASPKGGPVFFSGGMLRGGRYVVKNATMVDLISTAYGVDADKVQGGPSWLEKDRFDVIAKVPAGTTPETVNALLKVLLLDRFKLVVHQDTKPVPVFVLSAGKGKPKLKEAASAKDSGCDRRVEPENPAPGVIPIIIATCHNMTMDAFVPIVQQYAGAYLTNPVIDATGLKGNWDFEFRWTGRGQLGAAGAEGISIFDAMDKQLGLKLEAGKVPMPVILVDSLNEKPTDNPPGIAAALPPPPPAEFEVAVIKPSKPDAQLDGDISNGQVSLQATTLQFLVTFAWNLNPNAKQQIVGAPKWFDSDKFDILAKTSADVAAASAAAGANNGPSIDIDDLRHMLQVLLIERFQMKVHMEDRPIDAYTLTAANPKMKKADPTNRTGCKNGPGPDGKDPRIANPILNRLISCQNITMAEFAEQLRSLAGGYLYTPVLDSTGLEGAWDFTLSFSAAGLVNGGGRGAPAQPSSDANAAPDPNGALSLYDAVYKQLGLKLEKTKRPVPVLVIDHVEEKPTDN
jgi:uncharacterized protein (TIGR03435 family)